MYKAKILKIENKSFYISIPALKLDRVEAYALTFRHGEMNYREGDLVIVDETNDPTWVILGLVYGADS